MPPSLVGWNEKRHKIRGRSERHAGKLHFQRIQEHLVEVNGSDRIDSWFLLAIVADRESLEAPSAYDAEGGHDRKRML